MGNNKNKNPKKEIKRGQESTKSCSSRTASDQKENRPKKTKIKPDPGDKIAMSRELIKHKKIRTNHNRNRTKKNSKRNCPNGKPMPSLVDLEKMFEDSDSDNTDSKDIPQTNNTETLSPVDNVVVDIDTVFSPNTCSKVSQQCKEILNNWSKTPANDPTPTKIQSPPRKRLIFDTCEDLPLVVSTPKKIKCDRSDTQVIGSSENDLRMSPISELVKDDEKLTKESDEGNVSETSVDSNKTIEYKITSSTLQSSNVSQAFSPLPSTSKDSKTFSKNDELFFECTKEINNNKIKEILPSSPVTDIPMETKELDNEVTVQECQEEVKKVVDDDIEIVETPNQIDLSTNPGDKKYDDDDDDDDDCIFVCYTNTPKQVSKEPEIIDLEYDFIDTDEYRCQASSYDNIDDEDIIDVDALIAKNQSILNKYKTTDTNKLDTTNLVVNVDVTNQMGTNNMQKHDNKQTTPSLAPEISNNTHNLQGNPNHEDEAFHITDLDAENRRHNHVRQTLSNNAPVNGCDIIDVESTTKQTQNQHIFTEQDVSKFFNGDYEQVDQSPSFLFDLVQQLQFANDSPANQFPEKSRSSSVVQSPHARVSRAYTPPFARCLGHYSTPHQNQINWPETSQRSFNTSAMFENTPHVPTAYQRTTSTYPICQPTQPTSSSSQRARYSWSPDPTLEFIQRLQASPSNLQRIPPTLAPIFEQMPPAQSTTQNKPKTKKNKNKKPLLSAKQPPEPCTSDKSSRKLGECPICMDILSERVIASTICGHVFCMSCLEQAIKTNKRCPTCRKIIKKNGYHQIFL